MGRTLVGVPSFVVVIVEHKMPVRDVIVFADRSCVVATEAPLDNHAFAFWDLGTRRVFAAVSVHLAYNSSPNINSVHQRPVTKETLGCVGIPVIVIVNGRILLIPACGDGIERACNAGASAGSRATSSGREPRHLRVPC
jgi:hypothetical protein